MEDISFLKKIAKGAGIVFFGIIVSKILTYAFRAIIARYFGASVYGLLVLAIAITGFVSSVALLGLPRGLLRYIAYYLGKGNNIVIAPMIGSVVRFVFPICLALGVITFFFAEGISTVFFHKPELTLFLKIAAALVPLLALYNIFDHVLQAFQEVKSFVFARNLVDPLSKLLLLAVLALIGVDSWGIIFAYVFGIAVSVIVMILFLRKRIVNFSAIFLRPGKLFKSGLFYYSLPLLFADFLVMILAWTDVILLGVFVTSADVGIYDAASATSRLLAIVPLAFSTIFMPAITELFGKDRSRVGLLYKHITKWVFLLLLPMFFFIAMFSKSMLSFFFGSEFGMGAVSLVILLLTELFWSVGLLSSNILAMFMRTKWIFFNNALAVVVNLVLNIILIPKLGIIGAAIGTSSTAFFVTLLYVAEAYYLTKTIPFDLSFVKVLISVFVPVICLFVIFRTFIINLPLIQAVAIGLMFSLVYFLLLFLTKSFDSTDLEIFRMAIRKYNPVKK